MSISIDWGKLEEVVERAVKRARAEELREVAEAIKTLAKYVKKGFDIIEEHSKVLTEHSRVLAEHSKVLAEHSKRLEELAREVRDLRRTVAVIAHRFGVLTEESFREAMRYVVEEVFGVARVEKWVYNDVEGVVYGAPAVVEANLLINDKEHILVEIKPRISRGDVMELHNIGELYKRVTGIKPRLVIVGGFIDRGIEELAKRYGVEIISITQF
jgi:hypothetical protein